MRVASESPMIDDDFEDDEVFKSPQSDSGLGICSIHMSSHHYLLCCVSERIGNPQTITLSIGADSKGLLQGSITLACRGSQSKQAALAYLIIPIEE